MEPWVAAVIAASVVSTAYAWWKQHSFSILTSAACILAFLVLVVEDQAGTVGVLDEVAFMPRDVTHLERLYTLLTSMYAHGSLSHIVFNLLVLVMVGAVFEERIGARAYILLYFIAGLAGTLMFAALNWNDEWVAVVGASGAISGVLGGFARLYPNERFTFLFFPFFPIPSWLLVVMILILQFFYATGDTNIAWEAHLGGLAAGVVFVPLLVRMPLHRRVKRMISMSSLRKLATTAELKSILRRIEEEEVPDVRSAWIEHFLSKATCPYCGSRLKATREAVVCQKGHLV